MRNCLFTPLEALEDFQKLANLVQEPGVFQISGLDDTQRLHLLAALMRETGRPLLFVAANDMAAQRVAEDLNVLLGGGAKFLPARDVSFLRTAASSRELSMRRLEALGQAATGEARALVVPADALLNRLMPREEFLKHVLDIAPGMRANPTEMIARLVSAGYERVQLVEARGQCALRGGILDVYPVGMPNALRLEFFDDEIDSLRTFDVMTQRSVSMLEKARLYPAGETLLAGSDALRAAQALKHLLRARASAMGGDDRQKKLEKEFGLIPFEEFLRLTGEESAPSRETSAVEKNFARVLDQLETGREPDGADTLLPVLLGYRDTALSYLEAPILVLDQPDRLRERAQNRTLEFHEQFASALEHDEALPMQADLLFSWEYVRAGMEGMRAVILYPFLRTEEQFRPQAVFSFEGRNATGYMGNIPELARDIAKWRADGWRIILLAGGMARSKRLKEALEKQEIYADCLEEIPEEIPPAQPVILPFTVNRGFLYPRRNWRSWRRGTFTASIARRRARGRRRGKSWPRLPIWPWATMWCMKIMASASTWAPCAWLQRAPIAIFCTFAIRARISSMCPPISSIACRSISVPRARRPSSTGFPAANGRSRRPRSRPRFRKSRASF